MSKNAQLQLLHSKILENQRKHKCTNVFHELINTVAHEALQMTNWIINIYYKM